MKDFHGNDPRFIFHLLNRFDLKRFASGAGVPTLNRNFVNDEIVCIPPFPEQLRIVRILDQSFAAVATAKENIGKNLENSRALFEHYLTSAFQRSDGGQKYVPLGTIAVFRNGINFTQRSKGERVSIVGVKDFQDNFWVPQQNLETVTIDGSLPETDRLTKGDILAVRSNGNIQLIGRTMLAGEVSGHLSHSGFTIRIRLQTDEVLPEYLCNFMRSAAARKRLVEGGTGVNIKSLNQQTLSTLLVPSPPAPEQHAIVNRIREVSLETQHLQSLYRRKLAALDELKKSLLHQAFSGNL
ncbi:MAG TPA: hypothetical protein VHU83_22025 [Bryobacteraceae bacterium]|nr:hypothetical protein [Bryobacteraceae bacterium]